MIPRRLLFTASAVLLTAFAIAGCGGGGGGGNSPIPNPTNAPPVVVPTAGAGIQTKFQVTVSTAASSAAARFAQRRYDQTPAAGSMKIAVTSNATQHVETTQTLNLAPGSSGCSASSPTVCALTVQLQPGSYTATIATYAQAGAAGTALSQGQRVPFSVQSQPGQVNLALGSLPASYVVTSLTTSTTGSQRYGYVLAGIYPAPRPFNVVARDSASNVIVGDGAPTFSLSATNPAFVLSQPAAQSPNDFSITPAGTQPQTGQLTATATLGDPAACARSGVVCTTALPVAFSPFASDDWPTFAHDYKRTGEELTDTGISSSNVAQLTQRWSVRLPHTAGSAGGLVSGPLVYGGNVIVVGASVVYDLSAATGATLWTTPIPPGGPPPGTPTLDAKDGLIFIGQYNRNASGPVPSEFYALRISDGSVAWKKLLPGQIRSAPVYANGVVYEGWAGGDAPTCINGGVGAFDAQTGATKWTWLTNPVTNPLGGGGIWGAIAYDGNHVYFGTGNTCTASVNMQGAVSLNLDGSTNWAYTADSTMGDDSDTGSGVMLSNGNATFLNKNDTLYNLNASTGKVNWSVNFGSPRGAGDFATPTTDGSITIVGAGSFGSGSSIAPIGNLCRLRTAAGGRTRMIAGQYSKLAAVGPTGSILWTRDMAFRIDTYAPIDNSVVIAGMASNLQALDINTGAILWSYANPYGKLFEPGPVVVPSGVYTMDETGEVYAFSLPAAAAPAAGRARR